MQIKAVKQKLKVAKRPYSNRKDFIEEIITKFKPQKPEEYKDFLKPLFLFIETEEEPTIDLSKEENSKETFVFENTWEPEDETKCKPYEEKKKDEKELLEFEIE